MNILIDTHILIWLSEDNKKLKAQHRELLADRDNNIFLSTFSAAEIMIKININKMNFRHPIEEFAAQMEIDFLPLEIADIKALKTMPQHHKDPFDRMLISQGINRNLPILTYDKKFSLYDCELI